MKVALLLALVAASVQLLTATTRYDGYKVYKVFARDLADVQALSKLQATTEYLDFWTDPSMRKPTDIMVSPDRESEFLQTLGELRMSYDIKIADVQNLIDSNRREAAALAQQRGRSFRYAHNWNDYSRLATIQDFMNELAKTYPSLVTVTNLGTTYGNNSILMMKVSSAGGPANKKAIFVDGGIHAREWISPAVVTNIISRLVEENSQHPEMTTNLDWYFVPVINPDGYEFSHTPGNRLWRKNRKPTGTLNCMGVDINRNFGYHWSEGGTSSSGCSDLYHGTAAFSELESQHLRDAITKAAAAGAKCYLTFHSYGQDMLYPWSYQNSPLPDDWVALDDLAKKATDALTAVYGTPYRYGNSYKLYGATAGSSDDWSKGGAGIPFAYTIELRDTGSSGFELPPSQIQPTCNETWALVRVVADEIMKLP